MGRQLTAVFSALFFFVGSLYGEVPSEAGRLFFEGKIRPLFEEHCLKCHSEKHNKRKGGLLLDRKAGWLEGGDSGEAVVIPGDVSQSLLLKMVHHDPDYEPMPPKSKLSKQQIVDLEQWVIMGAPDPRSERVGQNADEEVFDLNERKKWWSLQALAKVTPPRVENDQWVTNDVDLFLLQKLEEKGWTPAEPAAKDLLLRRVVLH